MTRNNGWRDISTMPKDGWGGPFLIYSGTPAEGIAVEAHWYGIGWLEPNERDGGWSFRKNRECHGTPTHWQPLPGGPL